MDKKRDPIVPSSGFVMAAIMIWVVIIIGVLAVVHHVQKQSNRHSNFGTFSKETIR